MHFYSSARFLSESDRSSVQREDNEKTRRAADLSLFPSLSHVTLTPITHTSPARRPTTTDAIAIGGGGSERESRQSQSLIVRHARVSRPTSVLLSFCVIPFVCVVLVATTRVFLSVRPPPISARNLFCAFPPPPSLTLQAVYSGRLDRPGKIGNGCVSSRWFLAHDRCGPVTLHPNVVAGRRHRHSDMRRETAADDAPNHYCCSGGRDAMI